MRSKRKGCRKCDNAAGNHVWIDCIVPEVWKGCASRWSLKEVKEIVCMRGGGEGGQGWILLREQETDITY